MLEGCDILMTEIKTFSKSNLKKLQTCLRPAISYWWTYNICLKMSQVNSQLKEYYLRKLNTGSELSLESSKSGFHHSHGFIPHPHRTNFVFESAITFPQKIENKEYPSEGLILKNGFPGIPAKCNMAFHCMREVLKEYWQTQQALLLKKIDWYKADRHKTHKVFLVWWWLFGNMQQIKLKIFWVVMTKVQ